MSTTATVTPSENKDEPILVATPISPNNFNVIKTTPLFRPISFDHFKTTSGIILMSQSVIGLILTVLSAIYVRNVWPFFGFNYYALSVYNIFWATNILIIISSIISINWNKLINNELLNAIKTIYKVSSKYVSQINISFFDI